MDAQRNGRPERNGRPDFSGLLELSGPFDEATLTRLANEFFTALPGEPDGLPGLAAPAPEPPAAPPETPGSPAAPTAAMLASVPDSLDDPAITVHTWPQQAAAPLRAVEPATPSGPTGPGWPGGGPAGRYPPPPGAEFYFLDPSGPQAAAAPVTGSSPARFDVAAVRHDFPILGERVNGHPLVWLDNAATTQKPQEVIDRLARYYAHENSNIHRGDHELAERSTEAYEDARDAVARFLGAPSSEDIVFVRGATEGINLVAQSWGRQHVRAGDEIVLSHLEHHANIVPWQLLAEQAGATLRVIPVDDSGQIILDEYRALLTDRTRLVAIAHVSNALGTILPLPEVIGPAHEAGARVLVDGAQAVSHMPVDVQGLDADFYVFSGHKVFGPTGIGALYGKPEVLDAMPPWQGGGNMIRNVTFEHTAYQPPPARFEAGTPSIADAVGLGTALRYVDRIGRADIASYEHELLCYAIRALADVPGLRLVGTAPDKASILSFVLDGYRPEDVGSALNDAGIAVRAGHHCAQPVLRRYGLAATVRAALALYNTYPEVDALAAVLHRLAAQRARV
ncbi:MAG: family 2A encapsulin nanocompartment cargo protein cysteine desulfurase [Streptosporangiaceae bacterium]